MTMMNFIPAPPFSMLFLMNKQDMAGKRFRREVANILSLEYNFGKVDKRESDFNICFVSTSLLVNINFRVRHHN